MSSIDVKGLHFVGEVVVSPDGRDGHKQAESGGDERFSNTAGNRGEAGGLAVGDALKRVQDADDGPEETYERRGGTDSSEGREAALHFGMDDGHGALQAALRRVNDVGVRNLLRSRLELGETRGDHLGDVALLIALGNSDGFVELAVLESTGNLLHEDARLLASRAVHKEAVNHNAEGIDGENKEDEYNDERERAHVLEHVA